MLHYGIGVAQEVKPFHVKHSTRHPSRTRSEATQTYNPICSGIGNEGYMHLASFHNSFSSHILYLFKNKHNTTSVRINITAKGRQMPVTEELIDI
jgi:hypothetical protein